MRYAVFLDYDDIGRLVKVARRGRRSETEARKAYDEAIAQARKAYDEAIAQARKAYAEAKAQAEREAGESG